MQTKPNRPGNAPVFLAALLSVAACTAQPPPDTSSEASGKADGLAALDYEVDYRGPPRYVCRDGVEDERCGRGSTTSIEIPDIEVRRDGDSLRLETVDVRVLARPDDPFVVGVDGDHNYVVTATSYGFELSYRDDPEGAWRGGDRLWTAANILAGRSSIVGRTFECQSADDCQQPAEHVDRDLGEGGVVEYRVGLIPVFDAGWRGNFREGAFGATLELRDSCSRVNRVVCSDQYGDDEPDEYGNEAQHDGWLDFCSCPASTPGAAPDHLHVGIDGCESRISCTLGGDDQPKTCGLYEKPHFPVRSTCTNNICPCPHGGSSWRCC